MIQITLLLLHPKGRKPEQPKAFEWIFNNMLKRFSISSHEKGKKVRKIQIRPMFTNANNLSICSFQSRSASLAI